VAEFSLYKENRAAPSAHSVYAHPTLIQPNVMDRSNRFAICSQFDDGYSAGMGFAKLRIFSLREKLVPLGKLNIIEDMAAAAEEYYAKLPPDLVSDVTRRHQVMLALNRAVIANGVSDDEAAEAAGTKALALASDLLVRFPNDESLREEQYEALCSLAYRPDSRRSD